MFRTLIDRQAQHAVDMDATSLVDPEHLSFTPDVAEEGVHDPHEGAGPLWNESWYFDATSLDGNIGMYGRLGRLPNQNICKWFSCDLRVHHFFVV